MNVPSPARLLVVDDEDAILETMSFTFADDYEVLTTNDARRALEILDEQAPVAVVLSDQRMPHMTGVELLAEVYKRHPDTVRIMLTGFADSDATIQAINDGHIYAYLDKPWEPTELKQTVKNAVELFTLTLENRRLLEDLADGYRFLEALMDKFETGAVALDNDDVIHAINHPARRYLKIDGDPAGSKVNDLLQGNGLDAIADALVRAAEEEGGAFEGVEVPSNGSAHQLRISARPLEGHGGSPLGRVLFFKEISHEPLRRRFEELLQCLSQIEGDLRDALNETSKELSTLGAEVSGSGITSPSMSLLAERVTRTQTAISSWLEIDDLMCREDFPDAQMLIERMRIANKRWPASMPLPARVEQLGQRVESYYESGENPKQRVL
ncbi:MAG: response regulator [Myxococcota bacterium]|jgi:CheY-like chemotaxis protein|nr:response regulator [Myxococcota bacterium]